MEVYVGLQCFSVCFFLGSVFGIGFTANCFFSFHTSTDEKHDGLDRNPELQCTCRLQERYAEAV